MEKIILHCDLNNFFASVECALNPLLKNYPMAVCGSAEDRHGIVLAKNDLAKATGVTTAEVIWKAKQKCPNLVCVKPNMKKYIECSKKVQEIYKQYTDLVEPFSIDECFLDVTASTLLFGNGYDIAFKIKEQVKKELDLTISVGVSYIKIFAKLASDMKKPDAITTISKSNYKVMIWDLPVNTLMGVGKSNYKTLCKYGVYTIGDLANSDKDFITRIIGKNGEKLWEYSNGIDNSKVTVPSEEYRQKSISNSTTCKENLTCNDDVWRVIYSLTDNISMNLIDNNIKAFTVQCSIKDSNLNTVEFQKTLEFPTRNPKYISEIAYKLFTEKYDWKNPIRAVGITLNNLVRDNEPVQLSLTFCNENEDLEKNIFSIRKKYGDTTITRASLIDTQK